MLLTSINQIDRVTLHMQLVGRGLLHALSRSPCTCIGAVSPFYGHRFEFRMYLGLLEKPTLNIMRS